MTKKRVKAGRSKDEALKKRMLFVNEYIANGGNATQAAIDAGFSPKTAKQAGSRLLSYVDVREILNKKRAALVAESDERAKLSAADMLDGLARDHHFDPIDLVDENGASRSLHDIPKDARMALRGMEIVELFEGRGKDRVKTGRLVKFKFPERTAAREQGMKHFGMYEKDNSQKTDPVAELLRWIADHGTGIQVKYLDKG